LNVAQIDCDFAMRRLALKFTFNLINEHVNASNGAAPGKF
jgi:hypothetical protein